jgi:hypothetical protein
MSVYQGNITDFKDPPNCGSGIAVGTGAASAAGAAYASAVATGRGRGLAMATAAMPKIERRCMVRRYGKCAKGEKKKY